MPLKEVEPAVAIWLALIVAMAIGLLVNKIARRPLVNWAAWLGWWYLVNFGLAVLLAARGAADIANELGRYTAAYLLPALLALYYARRWRRARPYNRV